MKTLSFWKKSIYSAVIFFGTLMVLSIGYATLFWGLTDADKVNTGSGLTATSWNRIIDGILDINTRLENLSFSGGRVGIGTADPGQKLTIEGTAPVLEMRSAGHVMFRPTANNSDMRIFGGGVQPNMYLGFTYGGAPTTALMAITQGGNVGIGTAAPQTKLDVAGSVKFDGVDELNWAGSTCGIQTVSATFTHSDPSVFEITAMFSHYGHQNNYGATRKSLVSNGPVMETIDLANITSTNCGTWSFTRNSPTSVTITKTAGTYNGCGNYFITVRGASNLSK